MITIKIKKLIPDAKIPEYKSDGASGFDLYASEDVVIPTGSTCLVPTGISVEIPEGYEMQIRPRSGLSLNSPIRIANTPGTIDSDYRGEIKVIVWNTDTYCPITIKKHSRIAQGVIVPVIKAKFEEVEDLNITERGSGGFGSTGVWIWKTDY